MRTFSTIRLSEQCHLDLHIIDYCQLRCRHCYLVKGSRSMLFPRIRSLCNDFMNTSLPSLSCRIILNGGDASLHRDFAEISSMVRDISGSVVFSTHGILIKSIIHLLHSSDIIQVSIDGDQRTQDWIRGAGNYAIAVDALYLLQKHQVPHTIPFTVTRQILHCIGHLVDLAVQTKSSLLNISYYSPVNPSDITPIPYSDYCMLKDKVRKSLTPFGIEDPEVCTETGCIGGVLGVSVLPDGTYWDCSRNQKIIGRFPQKIADVLDWAWIADESYSYPFITYVMRKKNE